MPRNVYLWDATLPLEDALADGRGDRTTDIINNSADVVQNSIVVGTVASEDDLEVVAVGLVRRKNGVAKGRSRITVERVLMFEPRLLSGLVPQMSKRVQGYISRVGNPRELYPVKLPPTAAVALLEALSVAAPKVAKWLRELDAPPPPMEPNKEIAMREVRDAISLALQVAERARASEYRDKFNDAHHIPVTDDVVAAVMDHAYLNDLEDDQLAQEVRQFREDTKVTQASGSVALLEGDDYRLTVFNVNRKPLEHVLGVDLVYWDLDRGNFTMLQYKRMTRERYPGGKPGEWYYTDERAIRDQLALMQDYSLTPEEEALAKNWRMASPYWFKFVPHDAAKRDDGQLLNGFYVAAPHLARAIDDGSLLLGERGGFRVTYEYPLKLTKRMFTELVIRGAIGTAGAQSVDLVSIVSTSAMRDRNVVVAVKEKWAQTFERNDDDLSALFRPSRTSDEPAKVDNFDDLLKGLSDGSDTDDGEW